MGTATVEFELTDTERAVRGLEFDEAGLRVRPTRRSLVDSWLAVALITGIGVWMAADPHGADLGTRTLRNPEAIVSLGGVLIVVGVVAAWGAFRPVASATAPGVEVRGLLRSRRYTWAQVAEARVDVLRVGRLNAAVGAGSMWLPWRRRPFEARAVLQLATGEVVVLRGLAARVSSSVLPDDHPTALKVAALARRREAQVGPPVSVAAAMQRDRIWPVLLSFAGYTAVLSWAAGRPDVDPLMAVITLFLVGEEFWQRTDPPVD